MIAPSYVTFRHLFSASGTDGDGFPRFMTKGGASVYIYRPVSHWNFGTSVSIDIQEADDSVAWTDRYHWYLSDPASTPRWQIVRNDTSATASRSGRVTLSRTSAGDAIVSAQGLSSSTISQLLTGVHLYANDLDQGVVVWMDLHRSAFSPASFVTDYSP